VRGEWGHRGHRRGGHEGPPSPPVLTVFLCCPTSLSRSRVATHPLVLALSPSFLSLSLSLALSLSRAPSLSPSCLVLVGWRDGWVAWRQAECDVSVPRRPAHIAAVRARSPTHHSLVDVSVHGCLRADGASCWQTRGRRRRKKRLRYGRDLLSVCTNSVA